MSMLIYGLILFLGVHSVSIVCPSCRDQAARKWGEWTWKGFYSVLSVIGLLLIVRGYDQARLDSVLLYSPPLGLRQAAIILLVPVFPLIFAAYFPGRIRSMVTHPMLLGVKLWALAHLMVNGSLADVLLFGSFFLWAAADRVSLKYRLPREIPTAPAGKFNDIISIVLGLAVYVIFVLWLHQRITGVSIAM